MYFPGMTDCCLTPIQQNCLGGVMVSMLASSVEDHGFDPQLGEEEKIYEIGNCCFSAKQTT